MPVTTLDAVRPRRSLAGAAGIALFALAAAYICRIVWTIATAVPATQVQYLPDDAFYYLTLARNFATTRRWSFDSGVSLTTGFHLLHAYVLATIYRVAQPGSDAFVRAGILVSALAIVPAFAAAAMFLDRTRRLLPVLFFFVLVMSRNVSLNIISAMEWSWVVSLSAWYCLVFAASGGKRSPAPAAALFALGFLGSFARTDFGLLPAAITGASLVVWRLDGAADVRGWIRHAVAGLGGATAGLGAVFIHNLAVSGQMAQSSAKMKWLWLAVNGPTPRPILGEIATLFGPLDTPTKALAAALAAAIIVLAVTRVLTPGGRPGPTILWLGCVASIAGYCLVYTFNAGGIANWYTANLIVPLFITVSVPLVAARPGQQLVRVAGVVLVLLAARQIRDASQILTTPEWAYQETMYDAGRYLSGARLDRRIGSWNAGIIGYFEGGTVVNLDGLVNNDVHRYAERNALAEYIDDASIGYVIDFEVMIKADQYLRRGGYNDPSFLGRLTPVKVFDDRREFWSRMTLFRVEPRRDRGVAQ